MSVGNALAARLLALTATFEGGLGAVAGNHDGQVLSLGPLQWNLGQGTLQPILRTLAQRHPALVTACLGSAFRQACLAGGSALSNWVRVNALDGRGNVTPAQYRNLQRLILTPEAQALFLTAAQPYLSRAAVLCQVMGWVSERALALAFDVAVQNGTGKRGPRTDHLARYRELMAQQRIVYPGQADEEWFQLKVFATAVADCANPRWRKDVLSRKLGIALGGTSASGMPVHGRHFNLERDYGIAYARPWRTA